MFDLILQLSLRKGFYTAIFPDLKNNTIGQPSIC
jgi:hypothetical protein